MSNKIIKLLGLTTVLLGCISPSFAERAFRVDGNIGIAITSEGGYDDGYFVDPSFSYKRNLIYRVGYLEIDQLYLNDTNLGSSQVEIEINGSYAGLAKDIQFKAVAFELGGGVIFAKTIGEYRGRRFQDEREAKLYLNSKLVIPLNKLFALQGELKYLNDISGSDLYLFGGGVRFSF